MKNKDLMQTVLDYIDENVEDNLSVGQLSEIAKYSTPQLFRLFKSKMDETPVKYVLKRRLYYAAKELISSDTKIIDIAVSFGFESHDSFCRAFKRVYGVTPNNFRKDAYNLNEFYRKNAYCISGYAVPNAIIGQGLEKLTDKSKMFEDFYENYGTDVEVVIVPAIKLIGVQQLFGKDAYGAFYAAYDRIFRKAPNRVYPNSDNLTHGIPRLTPDGKGCYFVGVEVTDYTQVPDGAVCVEIPEHLCAVIGFEGGIDYDTIYYYFKKWIKYDQNKYKADIKLFDTRFTEDDLWKTCHPIWEYYSPNKNCNIYEERIYMPIMTNLAAELVPLARRSIVVL